MDSAHSTLVPLGLLLALVGPVDSSAHSVHRDQVVLWLWTGSHDVRGLHAATGGNVEVAYWARTLQVGHDVVVHPRTGPIYLDAETARTAVVRIEVERASTAASFRLRLEQIVDAIAPVFDEPGASALQIDFDAPVSHRHAYGELLSRLRDELPSTWSLEMTALGTWCSHDRWLRDVPVDRIVPMLFGPGHEQQEIYAALRRGWLPEARCRESHGIREGDPATDAKRIYVFPQRQWTLDRAKRVAGAILGQSG